MNYPTLLELRTKVRKDLDLIDEPGITDSEIDSYINEAIDIAESEIHTLYEDYFKTQESLPLVSGTAQYDMPSDIFAQKIRAIIYHNDNLVYEITRFERKLNEFERIERGKEFSQADWYMYYTSNPLGGKPKINIVPTPSETSSSNVIVYYIRNAATLVDDTDICDIPEFSSFIIAYTKNEIATNKPGLVPNPDSMKEKMDALYDKMVETLSVKTPDQNDLVDMDLSHYEEHA